MPFLGEICIVPFNFAPGGWAFCDGRILPINQNQSLYSLLGNVYGGDGRATFALPDLRGRVPIHVGNAHPRGQKGGEASHTLTLAEMPTYQQAINATNDRSGLSSDNPSGNILGRSSEPLYAELPKDSINLGSSSVLTSGEEGGQAHLNMQPFIILHFCIALHGEFPPRN